MSLKQYHQKRNFSKTPEPKGELGHTHKPHSFVYTVQKHDASHLHYDFRLEMDGVLKSWAVPKGPSLDPEQKRLAMQVEDHPLEYANFEGIIPAGEYGGGTVMLWDQGIWEPLGDYKKSYQEGKLEFILHGTKLKGKWVLLRMQPDPKGKTPWLLVKAKDTESRAIKKYDVVTEEPRSVITERDLKAIAASNNDVWHSNKQNDKNKKVKLVKNDHSATEKIITELQANPLAKRIKELPPLTPQLATLVDKAPQGEEWLYEVKYDGYRLLTHFEGSQVKLFTRNGKDWTAKLDNIIDALQSFPLNNTILDGELIAIDKNNKMNFQLLQNFISLDEPVRLTYFIFDVPVLLGYDITGLPLVQRKELLQQLFSSVLPPPVILYSPHFTGSGNEIWQTTCDMGLEGTVAKLADSVYESRRTKTWLKLKCSQEQEFIIIGFTHSSKAQRGIRSLLLGFYDDNKCLHYAGQVGTGFTNATLQELAKKLSVLQQDESHFKKRIIGLTQANTVWVKPKLVGEIRFMEWTDEGLLRHPSFQGLRVDKNAIEVRRELPSQLNTTPDKKIAKKEDVVSYMKGTLTNRDKIIFTDRNISKTDLAEFYVALSDWILPHIINRPLMLLRCPQGQSKKCFFQKHIHDEILEGLYTIEITEKNNEKNKYIYIKDAKGLVALSQLAMIEMHPWGSNINALEQPDRLIFDLDPAPNVPWQQMIVTATRLRAYLKKDKLQSFVKVSGKKGLHIVVPLHPKASWEIVKEYSRAIAMRMVEDYPNEYIATMAKAKREGKIFIDFFRNNRGSTAVAPYSCRANTTASVSLPLSWTELSKTTAADSYDMERTLARIKSLKKDPWQDFFTLQQTLPQISTWLNFSF